MDSARSRSAAQSGGLGIASSNVRGSTTADAAAGSTAAPGVIPVPRRSGTIRAGLGGGPGSQAAAPAPPPPVVSKPLPEVHILGEIAGGSGFASGNGGTLGSGAGAPVCCKFSVETGDKWEWLGGHRSGQTHTVHPESGSDFSVWSHPIDLHYAAGSISGWPRLLVQVWAQDPFGRLELTGYGFVHVPAAAGMHEVECPVWRPLGTDAQEAASFFLGANPILKSSAVVYGNAAERFRLVTSGTGTVHVRFEIIFRNMEAYGVEW